MNLYGIVKAFGALVPIGKSQIGISKFGGLFVDPVVGLPMAPASLANRVFGATTATGTGIVPVTAVPTDAAAWFLFNDEADGGRDYYIDRVGCWCSTGTMGLGISLLVCVALKRQAIGPSSYASSIMSSLSGGPLDTKAVFDQAHTITGGTPAWINVASRTQLGTVEVGSGLVAELKGAFKVPPGHGLGLTVLSTSGTSPLFGVSIVWVEI